MNPSSPPNLPKYRLLAAIVFIATSTFYLYEYIVRVAPSVMLSELEAAFNTTTTAISASASAYYDIYAPMQILVGILFDRFGGKRLLIPATLTVALGCFFTTISTESLWYLTAGRFLMGLGSAFGFVGVMYFATVWYPPNRLAFLSGVTTAIGVLGAIMGETLLAELVDSIGWSHTFATCGIAGILTAFILFFTIPSTPTWERQRRQISSASNSNFFSGLISVLKNPQTWIIGTIGAFLYLPLSVLADLWGIQFIMKSCNVSKVNAATAISFIYFGWVIGGPLSGFYSDMIKRRKSPLFYGSIFSAIIAGIIFGFPHIPLPAMYCLLFLLGIVSSTEVVCFVAGSEINNPLYRSTSIGVINMIIMFTGGLLQKIVGFAIKYNADLRLAESYSASTQTTAEDFRSALLIVPILILAGTLLCLFTKESFNHNNSQSS